MNETTVKVTVRMYDGREMNDVAIDRRRKQLIGTVLDGMHERFLPRKRTFVYTRCNVPFSSPIPDYLMGSLLPLMNRDCVISKMLIIDKVHMLSVMKRI